MPGAFFGRPADTEVIKKHERHEEYEKHVLESIDHGGSLVYIDVRVYVHDGRYIRQRLSKPKPVLYGRPYDGTNDRDRDLCDVVDV